MTLSHVVSQGLADELRKAGWSQQATFFRWIRPEGPELTPVQKFGSQNGFVLTDTNYSFPDEWETYAAPLASELMERMPRKLENGDFIVVFRGAIGLSYAVIKKDGWGDDRETFFADTLPDALAKLCVHLIKEGKMKL